MPLAVLGMGSEALCVRIVHTSVRTYVRVCMHACDYAFSNWLVIDLLVYCLSLTEIRLFSFTSVLCYDLFTVESNVI